MSKRHASTSIRFVRAGTGHVLSSTFLCVYLIFFSGMPAVNGQDFSNKGRNFWLAYPDHVDGTNSAMGLYITSDVNATGNIRVGTRIIPFSVTANAITSKFIGSSPTADASNLGIVQTLSEGIQSNAGIQVTSDKPVVVYAHIINAARSGATLLLPVSVLGREYIVPSAGSVGASGNNSGYGEVTVVAPEAATTIEIITVARSRNGNRAAGDTIRATIANPGDVYQIQFEKDADISGTRVRSIASSTGGCKPIAVFSASTWSAFDCAGATGGDNLFQQLFPIKSWGRTFLTAPFINKPYDLVRVFVNEPNPRVFVTQNGLRSQLTALSPNGFYQIRTANPLLIESEGAPISVVHYMTSMSCDPRNPANCYQTNPPSCPYPSDPEMIVINPVEQTINNITVFSARQNWVPPNQSNVTQCYLNVIIKTAQAPSFRINGNAPAGNFIPIPGTAYSYLQENVSSLSQSNPVQNLRADSPFIAIAYGYGSVESYGYNAGTNVRDLSQSIQVNNLLRTIDFPATCRNSPFGLTIQLSYLPTQIRWTSANIGLDTLMLGPVPDSVWQQDGRTRYRFTLRKKLIASSTGLLPVRVTTNNPTPDGCGNLQDIDYDIEVFERPVADFDIISTGCFGDTVRLTDKTYNTGGRNIERWLWNFENGFASGPQHPEVLYPTRGQKSIRMVAITDVGCVSDTAIRTLALSARPLADIAFTQPLCEGLPVTLSDASNPLGETLVRWYWGLAPGQVDSLTGGAPRSIVFPTSGNVDLTMAVRTQTGCLSATTRRTLMINPRPKADFIVPEVCVNDATAFFRDSSRIADGSESGFTYRWGFGVLASPSTQKNPSFPVPAAAVYPVALVVTSAAGCRDTIVKNFTVNGAIPDASFSMAGTGPLCSNADVTIRDNSSVDFGKITRTIIQWDADNNPSDTTLDEDPSPGKRYAKRYPDFGTPATRTYRVRMVAYSGQTCFDEYAQTITVNASPQIRFDSLSPVCQEIAGFRLTAGADTSRLPGIGRYSGPGISADVFNPGLAGAGRHVIRFTQTSTAGCSAFRERTIEVYPTPGVDAGIDRIILEGDSVRLNAKATGRGLAYLWSPLTAIDDPTRLDPFVRPVEDTRYRLRVTSTDGCTATDEMQVLVLLKPIAPNTFTPNGDGVNDTWVIRHLEKYPGAILEVFSTTGQLLYREVGYSKPWDGTWQGRPQPAGTYYYVIDPRNGRPRMAGYVTIYR
jgi:gliding motility-associated-like protein